ncbi:alpha-N-acetyl-neuraminyl-2,3-beta-galactosyl-1,3-N-acetyl-galactosaminide alpha-2,6-sialyltransferase [Microcaecilia unicolor]|uniref:alpha-N-acetylneuraminyl-2,3-beta-galactosyl-1,3-N-acetylgalactosaminide6-alpha-sialyltransferase n=1 Tax=Microcaecilia unicolor TaxID=1415580 RepID=A0A6P7YGC9_9AMPH|nr:alpha-N-acetyl-neuraminyl-2,3-beta-galactosyl-1,3-N-acetyl-galactosaminide alpha-2,6-sialyltransferase [Microcaecilia unicolor]XP_030066482.1 alpha-N-acetyl-neuraminyl-2,3-beta-galactosyl-1,3-N-acetyl-galactosaminide alpha-2,6-sialyltransferase [Microcaecilia unicolor]
MNLSRAFAGVVILSVSVLLCTLFCQHFCFPLCWVRCLTLQEHKGSSIQLRSGMRVLWGYSRVSDGEPLLQAPCQQCAVVSSSGQMLGSRLGKEIDEAACVLRMNQAPTHGYEEDVGSRVTFRVVSHTSVPLLLRNDSYFFGLSQNTLYVIWGPPKLMSRDKGGRTYRTLKKMKDMYPSAQIYTLTEAKMAYCDQIFQNETGKNRIKSGSFLSTGWFTMILAMELCEHISVYGMVSGNYCREKNLVPVPYHYFEKGKLDECKMYLLHEQAVRGAHRFITEKMVFSRWAKQKGIVFTHPSWKDT